MKTVQFLLMHQIETKNSIEMQPKCTSGSIILFNLNNLTTLQAKIYNIGYQFGNHVARNLSVHRVYFYQTGRTVRLEPSPK